MGVITKIRTALGLVPADDTDGASDTPMRTATKAERDLGAGRRLSDAVAPRVPVAIDLTDLDHPEDGGSAGDSSIDFVLDDHGEEKRLTSRKAKQELVTELQKNYKEVLELVRRVQSHLDLQEERSTRLMEIVERLPEVLDGEPERRAQTERLIQAVERVSEVGKTNHDVSQQSLRELAKANEQLVRRAQSEGELVETMTKFRDAAEDIATNNQAAAGAVRDLASRADQRDTQLADAIVQGRKWLVIGVVVTASAAAFALTLAAIALTR